MTHRQNLPKISLKELRVEIQKEYANVALDPNKGYPLTIFKSLGMGIEDVAVAGWIYERAIVNGIGSRVTHTHI